jgi:hypothetical protein
MRCDLPENSAIPLLPYGLGGGAQLGEVQYAETKIYVTFVRGTGVSW